MVKTEEEMKNISKIIILMLIIGLAQSLIAKGYEVEYNEPNNSEIELNYVLDDYKITESEINGVTFSKIEFEGNVSTTDKGYAELPYLSTSIQLSKKKNVSLEISETDFVEIKLNHPPLPSRGTIYRNQDPATIPYEIADESITDEFYPEDIATASEPFILRDIRGTNIYVYPFRYNAAKQILRIYDTITVRIIENDSAPVNPIVPNRNILTKEMDFLYHTVFINYDVSRFENELSEFGSILVIRTARDEDAIAPYIQWKREKGFTVYEEEVAPGTNVTSLVSDQYNLHNDILYVQLVGDWSDIQGPTSGGAPTDPILGCVVGTDSYPDLIVGRFSASNASDVTTQVNKSIDYEKNPDIGAVWYESAVGVASNQGPGDDNELDYEHLDVIWNDKLNPFSYEIYEGIYDPSANATMVTNAVNSGTGIINYTGHGSHSSWGSSGFSNTNVNSLSNGNMLPFIISVACVNGEYHTGGDCFAEAWLKMENGGAVGMFASTINQSWNPPMQGQDYINDLLIGGYNYDDHPGQSGINTDVQKTTFGSLCFNGAILMTVEDFGGGQPMMETWIVFGDASLQVRTAQPAELEISNNTVLMGVDFTANVTADGIPTEGAMVTFLQDEVAYSGVTDGNGNVSVAHSLVAGEALMTITGYNTSTISTLVTVVPPGGAYILFDEVTIEDASGNANGMADHGESISMDICLNNVGTETASGIEAFISSENPYINITQNFSEYGDINAETEVFGNALFSVDISSFCPDNEQIAFHIVINSDTETWETDFYITSHAPVLEAANFVLTDENDNGYLEPGETGTLQINLINNGTGVAENINGQLYSDDEFITIENTNSQIETLGFEEVASFDDTFAFTISENCQAIHNLRLNLLLNEELGYYNVVQIDVNVGFSDNAEYGVNGWEHSSLNDGTDEWHQSEADFYSETHSWKAGNTGGGDYGSGLLCALDSPVIELSGETYLSFYHWMDAEVSGSYEGECYDGGLVEIYHNDEWSQIFPEGDYPYTTRGDNNPPFAEGTEVYSGTTEWERAFFNLEDYSGTVQFRFVFGSDGAANAEGWYIDDITIVDPSVFLDIPQNLIAESISENQIGLSWEAPGTVPNSYNIYRRINTDYPYEILNTTTDTNYSDNVSSGTYFYVVTADYEGVESSFSNTAQAGSGAVSAENDINQIHTKLMQNYPNPFNPTTTISFSLINEQNEQVTLGIFNIKGQKIKTFSLNCHPEPVEKSITWNGKDESGNNVSSGIYFYTLKTGKTVITKKMVLIK